MLGKRHNPSAPLNCIVVHVPAIKGSFETYRYFVLSGLLYVLGGYCDGKAVDTVQSFNISTQAWSTVPSMQERRVNPGVAMRGNQIAVCGGYNGSQYLATCEQFDLTLQR